MAESPPQPSGCTTSIWNEGLRSIRHFGCLRLIWRGTDSRRGDRPPDASRTHRKKLVFSGSAASLSGVNHLLRQGRRLKQFNPIGKARQNVAHHYDLPAHSMTASSILTVNIPAPTQASAVSLETQYDKKQHLASKLPGSAGLETLTSVPAGGLGLYLAKETGWDVTGSPCRSSSTS